MSYTPLSALAPQTTGTWVPTFTGLTVVLGLGTVVYAGRWTRIGRMVDILVTITPAGGATVAFTGATTYCDTPGTPAQAGACVMSNLTTLLGIGQGAITTNSRVYPPSQVATSGIMSIVGRYEA